MKYSELSDKQKRVLTSFAYSVNFEDLRHVIWDFGDCKSLDSYIKNDDNLPPILKGICYSALTKPELRRLVKSKQLEKN